MQWDKKTASGVTTVYHYDVAGNLIAETTAGGTPLRDIVYMNGERVAMKLYGSQAGWYFFVNDHLGTPQKIIDSTGTVVWAGFYLPFGKAWAYPATIVNNFRFPGQYYDAETGLHYNWHRYYDPDTGRYITADPIGLEGGVNLYAYVMGNPANLTDPTGEIPWDFIWDALIIAHDVITQDWQSMTADVVAFFIPYVPAGTIKVCKIGKGLKRKYIPNPKHKPKKIGNIGAEPTNPTEVLENSLQIKDTSTRRVGVDKKTGEFVVFDETHPGKDEFHGHVRSWDDLSPAMQKTLRKAGLVTKKGKIIQ